MLKKIDLEKKIDKDTYKKTIFELELKLGLLQREAKDLKIPITIVFEGWDASGKGTLINNLILALDPRGFKVYTITNSNEEEKHRPFLYKYWTKTPAKGRISVFDKSWYSEVIDRSYDITNGEAYSYYQEINWYERQLTDNGDVIIKFFLHIDKKEQKKRFEKLEKNPSTSWRVTKADWKANKNYGLFFKAYEKMLEKTDFSYSPWTVVESKDEHFATLKVFNKVIDVLEKKIDFAKQKEKPAGSKEKPAFSLETSILDKLDLSKTLDESVYEENLDKYQKELKNLEYEIYKKRIPVVIVFEGCDAAGKGGGIKRLTENLDPRGYEVVPVAAPNDIEKDHHYLWRFWMNMPKAGHITIFDRSWYGRVLVERVEGFCSESDWKRSFKEINEMEESLSNYGAIVIKFWLQIDQDEQLKRFNERKNSPYKNWKITEEDWRNREKWGSYKKAIDEMLFRTSTTYSPWTIVEANSKYYARIKILKTVIDSIKKSLI